MKFITFSIDGIVEVHSTAEEGTIEVSDEQALELMQDSVRQRRAAKYNAEASVYDLADAETKLASPDPAVQAEGAAQKAAVLARRLQIKAEIPKAVTAV